MARWDSAERDQRLCRKSAARKCVECGRRDEMRHTVRGGAEAVSWLLVRDEGEDGRVEPLRVSVALASPQNQNWLAWAMERHEARTRGRKGTSGRVSSAGDAGRRDKRAGFCRSCVVVGGGFSQSGAACPPFQPIISQS